MFSSTRSKLIGSFLAVSFLVGAVSLFIGGQLLYKSVLSEATNRVRLDLNAARELYQTRIKAIRCPLILTSLEPVFCTSLKKRDVSELIPRLETVARRAELDFVGIVRKEGETLCGVGKSSLRCKAVEITNPIAGLVFDRKVPVSGTVILSKEFLSAESPELADRARIELLPTPRAAPRAEEEETSGMAIAVAAPVFEEGDLIGVIYGGVLLNRNQTIVDTVRDTVFQQEIYKGRNIGTATIFFNDLRISTNVMTPNGKRAIGTRVSKEVKEYVLTKGKRWTDRAFVVSDWYITAYEPIEDIFGERVGMLYVGVLEAKYADMRQKALLILISIIVAGMALAVVLGYILANKIMSPVHQLIKASQEVSTGSLTPEIGPISKDEEMRVLQNTFKDMVEAVGRRRTADENKLFHSQKQASVGRLSAGIAHEINNPLTGILTYTSMLLQRQDIGEEVRSDLQTVVQFTERVKKIVKGLLYFSLQTTLDRESTDVNRLILATISLMETPALVKGVSIKFNPGKNLPMLTLDRSQFQSVLLNMIINALDATEPGGSITVSTGLSLSASDTSDISQRGVEISITDTGCGIPPEDLDKLFDPFFTTKQVGQGTGLGLSVSYGIVQRHGGKIRIQSEVGNGSIFAIWLPVEEQGAEYENTGN